MAQSHTHTHTYTYSHTYSHSHRITNNLFSHTESHTYIQTHNISTVLSIYLSILLSHTDWCAHLPTHTHCHARTGTHIHTHTHTDIYHLQCPFRPKSTQYHTTISYRGFLQCISYHGIEVSRSTTQRTSHPVTCQSSNMEFVASNVLINNVNLIEPHFSTHAVLAFIYHQVLNNDYSIQMASSAARHETSYRTRVGEAVL